MRALGGYIAWGLIYLKICHFLKLPLVLFQVNYDSPEWIAAPTATTVSQTDVMTSAMDTTVFETDVTSSVVTTTVSR